MANGQLGAKMNEQVIYIDHFELREGKLEDFRRYATEMTALVEKDQPGVSSFSYYMNEDGEGGTAVFVFSNPDSLDRYLDVASSKFQEGADLLSGAKIELLGPASDRAVASARTFGGTVKTEFVGFAR
jgi:hypothetical protein